MSRHHGIDYVELHVTDMTRAQAFYSRAFGWGFTDYGPGYAGIQKPGGGEWGGLCVVDQVQAGGPLVVLWSQDLEASQQAMVEAGGRLDKAIFSFPGGRRFEFFDSEGNRLAVWGQ